MPFDPWVKDPSESEPVSGGEASDCLWAEHGWSLTGYDVVTALAVILAVCTVVGLLS